MMRSGSLEPFDCGHELGVVLTTGLARDAFQQFVGRDKDAGTEVVVAAIAGRNDARDAIDEDVSIPDGRHAVLGRCAHFDEHAAVVVLVLDGLEALALGDREERSLHHVGMVFGCVVDQLRNKEVPDRMRISACCS